MDELKYKDGKLEISSMIDINGNIIESADNPEFVEVTMDSKGKVLNGTTVNGEGIVGGVNVNQLKRDVDAIDPESIKQEVKEAIEEVVADIGEIAECFDVIDDPEKRIEIAVDKDGKIISYRKENGTKVENVGIETNKLTLTEEGMSDFQKALKESGFNSGVNDWSDSESIEIPIPRCSMVNIINPEGDAIWPQSKKANLKYIIQFYDMQGNYFRKQVIFNLQGNTSSAFEKKNGAIDLCNNTGWDDDDTFKVKFGNWISQDSYHLKAYYSDFIKGSSVISYQIANDIYKERGVYEDRPWKKALIDFSTITNQTPGMMNNDGIEDLSLRVDDGARCMPDGFPCIVYLNGAFYGIYVLQLKKHRDNYHLNKKTAENIQLDGKLNYDFLWGGNVDWTRFEVRNPKDLLTNIASGYGYSEISYTPEEYTDSPNNVKPSDMTQADIEAAFGSNVSDWPVYLKYVTKKGKEKFYKLGASFVEYDGDNPKELLGFDTIGYDSENEAHVKSATVKSYIENLSKRVGYINSIAHVETPREEYPTMNIGDYKGIHDVTKQYYRTSWVSDGNDNYYMCIKETGVIGSPLSDTEHWVNATQVINDVRTEFEKYFDVDNIVDYQIINMAVDDVDAFAKNWQWVTYDGIKWYVCQYDKDMSFGNFWTGMFTRIPSGGFLGNSVSLPSGLCIRYYLDEHKNRWRTLVDKKIIDVDRFKDKINDWSDRIGFDNFKKEFKKWPNSPCNRDSHINFEYWIFTGSSREGVVPDWDENTNYSINDEVWFSFDSLICLRFRCIKECQNQCPLISSYDVYPKSMGYRDNVWRYYRFIESNIEMRNNFINSL